MAKHKYSNLYAGTSALIHSSSNVLDAINILLSRYELCNTSFFLARSPQALPFVRTTYPKSWVAQYFTSDYVQIDPVLKVAYSSPEPFFWHEASDEPSYGLVMNSAIEHGIKPEGYCLPIHGKRQGFALLTLNGHQSDEPWEAHVNKYKQDFLKLAQELYDKAVVEMQDGEEQSPLLTPREIECLNWVAAGKTYSEIATILNLSEHTIRSYLKTVRRKLDSMTLAQAVAKASHLQLINA